MENYQLIELWKDTKRHAVKTIVNLFLDKYDEEDLEQKYTFNNYGSDNLGTYSTLEEIIETLAELWIDKDERVINTMVCNTKGKWQDWWTFQEFFRLVMADAIKYDDDDDEITIKFYDLKKEKIIDAKL